MDKELLVVTCAIIRSEGKLLIARRHPHSRFEPGKWEFPGGKVDFGEDPARCMVREIEEELGVLIDVEDIYDVRSHVYSDGKGTRHVILLFYLCRIISGTPACLDCAEIRFSARPDLSSLTFVEGDLGVLPKIIADDSIWTS